MEKVVKFIEDNSNNNILFVLKGFELNLLGLEKMDLATTIDNKLMRLFSITQQPFPVISYDEFICLFDMAVMQFKKIYVIENPIYNYLFPVDVNISDDVSSKLLSHFDNDIEESPIEDTSLSGIDEYTNIYNNFVQVKNTFACSYNLDVSLLKNEKIQRILWDYCVATLDAAKAPIQFNLYSEQDYFDLTYTLLSSENLTQVSFDGFLLGKESIERKIQLLLKVFPNRIGITQSNISRTNYNCPTEIIDFLTQYWGYASFRDINIYDQNALKEKEKKVVAISQSQIISDLVEQIENCVYDKPFRDIFVTAPTGSGKSVMFQLPAMYIAKKYNLVTLVITPLIGLMNDQVESLEGKGYAYARTINSDISPVIKNEILDDISNGRCHILYLSPESLLSRSDIQQLIGNRRIGMIVVDESHIVTTWGKQFRPDYWYLGDHVQKIRRKQSTNEENPSPFIIATFTATAIYEGNEDMYHETLNSLHMIDPITYLGYVKRDDIEISITQVQEKKNKTEYEINKFDDMLSMIMTALKRNQKTLIYFPTVALINRFHDYCYSKGLGKFVAKYHGQLPAEQKQEGFLKFKNGDVLVMLATKAFGMGIDISDICIVAHFAPTGNVCDYMQEIGRAARAPELSGQAIYSHMSNDFKHINRLHGLSAIQKYQLVEVIKKVLDIYTNMRYKSQGQAFTKKRNEMLVDAESFGYIFEGPLGEDSDNLMNKVKTAMLLIQKDYENRGFAPFYIRPIPLFAYGYFAITPKNQQVLNQQYSNSVKLIHHPQNICEVNLKEIWDKKYSKAMSFPKFKFLLYSKSDEVTSITKYLKSNAMCADLTFTDDEQDIFTNMFGSIKAVANKSLTQGKYFSTGDIIELFSKNASISIYRGESVVNVLLASINVYQKEYSRRLNTPLYKGKPLSNGSMSYMFNPAIREFFSWLNSGYQSIKSTVKNSKIYIENDASGKRCKEVTTLLGILESFGLLRFKILGGSNSQIYIYVNETKTMQMVKDRPTNYKNKLLETINNRHTESVKMLKFLFQNNFSSEEVWNHLENYFIGILPQELCEPSNSIVEVEEIEAILQVQVGDAIAADYLNWQEINALFDHDEIEELDAYNIPLADYHSSMFICGERTLSVPLIWLDRKVAILSDCDEAMLSTLHQNGWLCLNLDELSIEEVRKVFTEG